MVYNRNFADEGDTPADASSWEFSVAAMTPYVGFAEGAAPELRAVEVFAWFDQYADFDVMLSAWASFDSRTVAPKPVEDFDDLWGARPATLVTGKNAPWVLQPGQTLEFEVNGEAHEFVLQERDFVNIADARAEELARALDRDLPEVDAVIGPSGRSVVLATTLIGADATLAVVGGTAATALGFYEGATSVGRDEEGGTFLRRAEFDFFDFAPGDTEVELFEQYTEVGFGGGGLDGLPDPHDGRGRFTFVPPDPFAPAQWRTTIDTPTLLPAEAFVGYSETLTVNW